VPPTELQARKWSSRASGSSIAAPSARHIAAASGVAERLLPAVTALRDAIAAKAEAWKDVVKIGRTHLQDATPLTLGQEWSGYASILGDDLERIGDALPGVYALALGGTAVGTGINAAPGFAAAAAAEIAELTGLPFESAPNKFAVQGAHDARVHLSGALRTMAVGSSIMPGKVNPTQAESLTMIAVQVMANDVAVGFGGAGGHLEMNVYKPLMISNLLQSITLLAGGCTNFRKFLVEGTEPDRKKIAEYVERSLMLVTALSPVIGYDAASRIAHHAAEHDLTLRDAALALGLVTAEEFDRIVDPARMVEPYVASEE